MRINGIHGKFDAVGNFQPQCVGLGTTAYASKPGLFTGGMLAMPIDWYTFDAIQKMEWDVAVAYVASRWGFTLVNR